MNQPDPAEIKAVVENAYRDSASSHPRVEAWSHVARLLAVIDPLLAALATAEEERDEAEKWGKEGWDWLEAVLGAIHPDATVFDFRELLAANYHKATGPQAAP